MIIAYRCHYEECSDEGSPSTLSNKSIMVSRIFFTSRADKFLRGEALEQAKIFVCAKSL